VLIRLQAEWNRRLSAGVLPHYLLQSCPVSLPGRVALSAQATGPGILAEIAIPAPQPPAASTLRPARPALLTSPAWPVRVSVGLANVHSAELYFSLYIFLCAIWEP
jgi:hypothetical protein